MAKKKLVKSHEQLVKEVSPAAICIDRAGGKPYKQIVVWSDVLGQGKTSKAAWTSAYRNIYGHR